MMYANTLLNIVAAVTSILMKTFAPKTKQRVYKFRHTIFCDIAIIRLC
jgi:hypothetical protein